MEDAEEEEGHGGHGWMFGGFGLYGSDLLHGLEATGSSLYAEPVKVVADAEPAKAVGEQEPSALRLAKAQTKESRGRDSLEAEDGAAMFALAHQPPLPASKSPSEAKRGRRHSEKVSRTTGDWLAREATAKTKDDFHVPLANGQERADDSPDAGFEDSMLDVEGAASASSSAKDRVEGLAKACSESITEFREELASTSARMSRLVQSSLREDATSLLPKQPERVDSRGYLRGTTASSAREQATLAGQRRGKVLQAVPSKERRAASQAATKTVPPASAPPSASLSKPTESHRRKAAAVQAAKCPPPPPPPPRMLESNSRLVRETEAYEAAQSERLEELRKLAAKPVVPKPIQKTSRLVKPTAVAETRERERVADAKREEIARERLLRPPTAREQAIAAKLDSTPTKSSRKRVALLDKSFEDSAAMRSVFDDSLDRTWHSSDQRPDGLLVSRAGARSDDFDAAAFEKELNAIANSALKERMPVSPKRSPKLRSTRASAVHATSNSGPQPRQHAALLVSTLTEGSDAWGQRWGTRGQPRASWVGPELAQSDDGDPEATANAGSSMPSKKPSEKDAQAVRESRERVKLSAEAWAERQRKLRELDKLRESQDQPDPQALDTTCQPHRREAFFADRLHRLQARLEKERKHETAEAADLVALLASLPDGFRQNVQAMIETLPGASTQAARGNWGQPEIVQEHASIQHALDSASSNHSQSVSSSTVKNQQALVRPVPQKLYQPEAVTQHIERLRQHRDEKAARRRKEAARIEARGWTCRVTVPRPFNLSGKQACEPGAAVREAEEAAARIARAARDKPLVRKRQVQRAASRPPPTIAHVHCAHATRDDGKVDFSSFASFEPHPVQSSSSEVSRQSSSSGAMDEDELAHNQNHLENSTDTVLLEEDASTGFLYDPQDAAEDRFDYENKHHDGPRLEPAIFRSKIDIERFLAQPRGVVSGFEELE